MCLVLWARKGDVVLLAGNRDEFHERPSQRAQAWADSPSIFAGRDLEKGGTWMGVTSLGRYATVTNFRHPQGRQTGRSRGEIVRRALESLNSPADFVHELQSEIADYPSFNLIVGDRQQAFYLGDGVERGRPIVKPLDGQVHVLSNGRLDEPWPKATMLRSVGLAGQHVPDAADVFQALASRAVAPPEQRPSTGVSPEIEGFLSAAFLVSPRYGTRASTVITLAAEQLHFEERSFGANGSETERVLWKSDLAPS